MSLPYLPMSFDVEFNLQRPRINCKMTTNNSPPWSKNRSKVKPKLSRGLFFGLQKIDRVQLTSATLGFWLKEKCTEFCTWLADLARTGLTSKQFSWIWVVLKIFAENCSKSKVFGIYSTSNFFRLQDGQGLCRRVRVSFINYCNFNLRHFVLKI